MVINLFQYFSTLLNYLISIISFANLDMTVSYINEWSVWLEPTISTFKWIEMREMPLWSTGDSPIQKSAQMLVDKKILPQEEFNALFADFGNIKAYSKSLPNIFENWNDHNTRIEDRWVQTFSSLKQSGVSYGTFAKLVEYVLMLPGNSMYKILFDNMYKNTKFSIGRYHV